MSDKGKLKNLPNGEVFAGMSTINDNLIICSTDHRSTFIYKSVDGMITRVKKITIVSEQNMVDAIEEAIDSLS